MGLANHQIRSIGRAPYAAAAAALLLLGACSNGSTEPPAPTTFGLEQRVVVSGLQFPIGLPQPTPLQTVVAFPNLPAFSEPVLITHAGDGTDRLFVVEKAGRVQVFANNPSTASAGTFLDIRVKVLTDSEQGLLGLAFDPDYATNGFFYVYYSVATPHVSRISRFRVSANNPNQADAGSEVMLLEVAQPNFGNHKAGMIAFGPDGKLYIAVGDGGSGNDPDNNAQNLNSLLGKMLRINTDGSTPADNPFVATAGARGEIWAYGLRNPFRMSFDRDTGRLWAGDVGQDRREEIDIIVRGGNYGWRIYEGTLSNLNPNNLPATDFVAPVLDYDRNLGVSVIGGYVYRGAALAGFNGAYFYGDFDSSRIWALVHDGNALISNTEVASLASNPSSFGEDEAGELYVVGFSDGTIYRFNPTQPPTGQTVPALLSQTGLFANLANLTPTPGLIEYDVNSPLWSDGAAKRRWLALPGTSRIGFSTQGNWMFPLGTVLVKHFELPRASGGMQRIETRVLVQQNSGWQGYTYRWNAGGTDAQLLQTSATGVYTVPDGNGGSRDIVWPFPSRADCLSCHTAVTGRILGVRTPQLNRDFAYPARSDNQLRSWNHIGLFNTDIGAHTQYDALARPENTSAPLAARARAYLEANCAHCHQSGGPTPVNIDLRARLAVADTHTVNIPAVNGVGGNTSAVRITPGDRNLSDLWLRLSLRGQFQMPPLATNQVDSAAAGIIGNWIDAGAP